MRRAFLLISTLLTALQTSALTAQVLEFESGGLKYKALTHGGVTIMYAPLPTRVLDYAILQVAISNGSPIAWTFKPEDFEFISDRGTDLRAMPADEVIQRILDKASRSDVGKLVTTYEESLSGNTRVHSTNGYESRRQDYMAIGSPKLRAASAASALALVTAKLTPGQSTDGAVFFRNNKKPLGAGKLRVNAAGEIFEFPVEAER